MSRRLALVLFALAMGLLLAELAVRTSDGLQGRGFFGGGRNPLDTPPRPVRPFRAFGPDYYAVREGVRYIASTHGELYPLHKPEGGFRIVCFGGSTTENAETYRLAGVHYPLRLQQELRARSGREDIEVINVGFSAYSTAHSLLLLALDVASWEADLAILSHATNDLSAAYWPNFQYDYGHKYGHPSYLGPDWPALYSTSNVLLQHSQLYWWLKGRWEQWGRGDPLAALQRGEYLDVPPSPACQVFERNLRSFVALARTHAMVPLLASQPLHSRGELFERHVAYKPYNDVVRYPTAEVHARHHRFFNGILVRVAREEGALFVDNDARMGDRDEFFIDHVHYTLAGLEEVVLGFVEVLLSNIPARSPPEG